MDIDKYLDLMKNIQNLFLEFLDNDENADSAYSNLIKIFNEEKIKENSHLLDSIIYFISTVANNHRRSPNFFPKIEKILKFFKEEIKQTYSNHEIFHIFIDNKRMLLFLFEENIITIDEYIKNILTYFQYMRKGYDEYFKPEIIKFTKPKDLPEIPENFEELRKNGVNESLLCEFIRNDSINDFIIYTTKNNIDLNSIIKSSPFETNSLLNHSVSLIEYTTFYGAIQIFKYLKINNVEMNSDLWLFSIHSRNEEIIQILEDENITPPNDNLENAEQPDDSFEKCLEEAVKCNHNEIADYIQLSLMKENSKHLLKYAITYFNFQYIQKDLINESDLIYFIKKDYYIIVEEFIKNKRVDVNHKFIIQNNNFSLI